MEYLFVVVLGASNIINPNFHTERFASREACLTRTFYFMQPQEHMRYGAISNIYCIPIPPRGK